MTDNTVGYLHVHHLKYVNDALPYDPKTATVPMANWAF